MQSTIGKEVWKPVIGYDGLYEVSNLGQVRASTDIIYQNGGRFGRKGDIAHLRHSILSPVKHKYMSVTLYDPSPCVTKRSKSVYIHILVSEAFQGHHDGLIVDHKDADKYNNCLDNLQRITQRDNSIKAYKNDESNFRTNKRSAVIRDDGKFYTDLKSAVADNIDVKSNSEIINAIKHNTKCKGHYWKYADANKQTMHTDGQENRRLPRSNVCSNWVRCVDLDLIMLQSDMLRYFNVSDSVIYDAIAYHKGYSKFLGYTFELIDEESVDLFSPDLQKYICSSFMLRNTAIVCINTGTVYMSMKHTSECLGVSVDAIKRSIRNKRPCRLGLMFKKVKEVIL